MKTDSLLHRSKGWGCNGMAIGEFDGAATLSGENGPLGATPMYWLYEMGHAALNPARAMADATKPVSYTHLTLPTNREV